MEGEGVSVNRAPVHRWREGTDLEVHPTKRFAPLDEEGETDVEVELGEGVGAFSLR